MESQWRMNTVRNMREIQIENPDNHKIIVAGGNIAGQQRKYVVIACYLPLNMTKTAAESALLRINDTVVMKQNFQDPYITIAGDFNQWKVNQALEDFQDI